MTRFERDYGRDPELALKMLKDVFKAPEQKAEAAEFLIEFANTFVQK